MKRRTLLITLLAAAGGLCGAAPASAQESPPGCTANRFVLDIIADRTVVRAGDTINYTVEASNVGGGACDVSNLTTVFRLPGPDGTASGPTRTLTTAVRYNAGTPVIRFGPFAHTVAVNPGVTGLVANVGTAPGAILHDPLRTPLNVNKNISSVLLTPSITIDKVGSMTGPAPAPQTVVYTFYVRNGSDPTLSPELTAISNVAVTDDKCGNPTYVRGDADGDGKLDVTETFEFTCTLTHPLPGTYTNVAYATGQHILYNRPVPVQSPPDNWQVVLVAPPPAPPQVNVKPTTVAQAPCTLSTPTGITVRARQLNTIRVRVRNVDAGSRVTITLPGGKKVSARTNANGQATLRVRPPKSGTARIRVAECSEVESLRVRPARRTQAQRNPRVTG